MRAQSRGESSSISELEWMKFVERRDKHQIQTLIVILKSTTALSKLTGDISMKSVIENNFFWLRPYQLEGIVIKICPLEKFELNWDNISSMALAALGRQSELWPHFATSTQIRTRRVAHFPPMGLLFVSSLPTQFLLAFFFGAAFGIFLLALSWCYCIVPSNLIKI